MDIFDVEETYYEKKIKITLDEFKKLFLNMLNDKNCIDIGETNYFTTIAIKTQQYYPEVVDKIDTVLYYYTEEQDSEEKLEYMMKLYKIIKENVYGN